MSTRSRRPTVQRSSTRQDEGSFLVEALVGIGALGAVAAAVATILPAVLDATVRATAHHTALMVGDSLLEADAAGIEGSVLPVPTTQGGVRVTTRVEQGEPGVQPWGAPCDRRNGSGASPTAVHVQHGGRADGREVVLVSGAVPSVLAEAGHQDLALRWAGQGPVPAGLVVLDPDGEVRPPTELDADCVLFGDVPAGMSWVTDAAADATLIDPVHVPLDLRPHAVTLASRSHDLTLEVERAAWLEADLDDGGGRRPDHVGQGALRWLVRGDEANVTTGIGDGRWVHPGSVTVVVPGCDDSTATGSTATVEVGPGEDAVVQVPLAVVTIENLRGRTDVWLQLQRSTGCADGMQLLPEIRFEGGLHEGMRIALPRGEWDAWLRRPASRALTPSVRFAALGADTVVRLP